MTPVPFEEQTATLAEDQPEYQKLPSRLCDEPEGRLICCWQLTEEERQKVAETGVIWHEILTFWNPLQPQFLSVDKPEMGQPFIKGQSTPWQMVIEYKHSTKPFQMIKGFEAEENESVEVLLRGIPEEGGNANKATFEKLIRAGFQGGLVAATARKQ